MATPTMYRASTVCEVTGLKPVTLRQWHLRGIYTPETEGFQEWTEISDAFHTRLTPEAQAVVDRVTDAERHGWRLYTFDDTVRIEIIRRLIRLGVRPERAGLIARHAFAYIAGIPNDRAVTVTSDGKAIPRRPLALEGPDIFACVREPGEGFEEHQDDEHSEGHGIRISIERVRGPENIGAKFVLASADDFMRTLWNPETGIVINISAIARSVKTKIEALSQ